jgi:hypothetical protein
MSSLANRRTVGLGNLGIPLNKTRNVNLVIAFEITRRFVVAHNDHSYARFNSDAYSEVSCGVPYNLSEVPYFYS